MTRSMKDHKAYMESQLPSAHGVTRDQLFLYHEVAMRDFQHERLVHLLVMMLVILVTVSSIYMTLQYQSPFLFVVDIILLPLTFAYILHYRSLENGVQSMYTITEKFRI